VKPPDDVAAHLDAIPIGAGTGHYNNRRYLVTRSLFAAGKSQKLVAQELGGPDYISLNFYALKNGPRLYPCEMLAEKVISFLRGYRPDPKEPT
jgi:hypothetical protein